MRGRKPGSVVACGGCSNPVVVPHEPESPETEPEPEPAAIPAPTPAPPDAGRSPWGTALLVLVVVAVGHVGLYLLLTVNARSEIKRLESTYAGRELVGAKRPDEGPAPGTPAYRPWRRAHDLWLASGEYGRHRSHVGLLKKGFFFSFLVQVGITGWILMRVLGKRRRATSRRAS